MYIKNAFLLKLDKAMCIKCNVKKNYLSGKIACVHELCKYKTSIKKEFSKNIQILTFRKKIREY